MHGGGNQDLEGEREGDMQFITDSVSPGQKQDGKAGGLTGIKEWETGSPAEVTDCVKACSPPSHGPRSSRRGEARQDRTFSCMSSGK